MKEIELSSWAEFHPTIDKIKADYGEHEVAGIKQTNLILYRGQPNYEWRLNSTLERFSSHPWSVESYGGLALRCGPQVESFTDRNWNLPDYQTVESDIKTKSDMFFPHIPCYDFWAYLRHHSFPSPLLDWTMSPYIAAYFALGEQHAVDKSAIFAYVELPKGTKGGWGGAPLITVRGPYVRTHRRHFLQQSCYTVCTRDEGRSHIFSCHEDVFYKDDPDQDILIKISIPRSERLNALSYLHEMNINHFTLFQSEEALMRTLAFKEIEMKP